MGRPFRDRESVDAIETCRRRRSGGLDDRVEHPQVAQAVLRTSGSAGSPSRPATCSRNARAWKTKRSFWPWPTLGEVHRQAAGDVRVVRADAAPAGSPAVGAGAAPVDDSRTRRPGRGRTSPRRSRRTSRSPARSAGRRDPRGRERRRWRRTRTCAVKVTRSSFSTGSRSSLSSAAAWPDRGAQRQRAARVTNVDSTAPRTDRDRAAQELGQVDQVAADVGERARARAALVAPAHRARRVAAVVAPVVAVEVQRPARSPRRRPARGSR